MKGAVFNLKEIKISISNIINIINGIQEYFPISISILRRMAIFILDMNNINYFSNKNQ